MWPKEYLENKIKTTNFKKSKTVAYNMRVKKTALLGQQYVKN